MNSKVEIKEEVIEWGKIIFTAIIFAFIIIQFIRPTLVRGDSMYPTLKENDYLIVNKMSYKFDKPKYGDIIVFSTKLLQEGGESKDLVKRVIATEGDHIKIENSNVYINGKLIEESYINDNYTEGNVDMIIPEGKIFTMGDNRQESLDSRYEDVGVIGESDVMGKVIVRLFPFDNIGIVK